MRHGFLLIDKPKGPTSHDIVYTVRKVLGEKKVGHLGTLDPMATGLVIAAVGAKALKVVEYFNELSKEYVADITCGAVSSTYDAEGMVETVTPKPGWEVPTIEELRRVIMDKFSGKITQVPPTYSAVKIEGQRAYDLARAGKEVIIKPRTVEIKVCEIIEYNYPKIVLRVECSSGTYIRSLAHDIGQSLRCGAHLSGLRRTKVGEWNVKNSVQTDDIKWTDVMPLKEVLKDMRGVQLSDQDAKEISFGRKVPHQVKEGTVGWHNGLPIVILDPAKDGSQMAQPRKVL